MRMSSRRGICHIQQTLFSNLPKKQNVSGNVKIFYRLSGFMKKIITCKFTIKTIIVSNYYHETHHETFNPNLTVSLCSPCPLLYSLVNCESGDRTKVCLLNNFTAPPLLPHFLLDIVLRGMINKKKHGLSL